MTPPLSPTLAAAPAAFAPRRTILGRLALSLATAACLLASAGAFAREQVAEAKPKAAPVSIAPGELPLDRDGASLVAIPAPGRYAIRAKTGTGARIELVDMIAGPLDSSGAAGLRDGRIDALLDKGVYKLRIGAVKDAKGKATLTAEPFTEIQTARPALAAGAPQGGDLGDMQQRSYALESNAERSVYLEAVGRSLQDLRVWQADGTLVDLAFERTTVETKPGRPMNRLRLEGKLPAGRYTVTAYGGERLVWSDGAAAQPFLIRLAEPRLLAAGVAEGVIGPFGAERFDAPASYDAFRLELPKQAPARLEARRGGAHEVAAIGKASRAPAANLRLAGDGAAQARLDVSGYEGQAYALRAVRQSKQETFEAAGPHLVSVDLAGEGGDEPPATALFARLERDGKTRVIASDAPRIGAGKAWRGKFNLLGPASLLFEATRDGPVAIDARGVSLRATIEPALGSLAPRADGKDPTRYDLPAGFYFLMLDPVNGAGGVVDVTLGPPGLSAPAPALPPTRATIAFGEQQLESNGSYLVLANRAPDMLTGVRVVALPAALDKASLALHQAAGKEIVIPLRAPKGGRIVAYDDRGAEIPLALSGEKIENDVRTVTAKIAGGEKERAIGVVHQPDAPAPEPLESAKAAEVSKLRAGVGKPAFFDLAQDETKNLRVAVAEGGLYRVETLGRIKTAMRLGASVAPRLGEGDANGAGGASLVTAFLRAGDYRAAVTAKESAGHLGLSVTPAALAQTAKLTDSGTARATLAPGKGAAIPMAITRAGDYSLALTGLKRTLRARLEDADGWPITQPGVLKQQALHLEPGAYRLVVLPEDVEARMVFALAPVVPKPALEGHGPHPLPFDDAQSLQWREPQARDAPRTPDIWRFRLRGDADVTLTIGEGMIGDIVRGADENVGKVVGDRPFKGKLAAGDYRVEARSLAHDDRLDYEIDLASTQLQPGAPRTVDLPAKLSFSLADEMIVDLATFGNKETIGVLKNDAGEIVERLQPRENDWNVALSRRLPAGAYRLELEALGATRRPVADGDEETASGSEDGAETEASDDGVEARLAMFDEKDAGPLAWGEEKTLASGAAQRVSLSAPPAGALALVSAHAAAEVAISIERRDAGGAWRVVGVERGLAPIAAWPAGDDKSEWRATLWPVGGADAPITVEAQAFGRLAQSAGDVSFGPVSAAAQTCAGKVETPSAALVEFDAPEGVVAGSAPGRLLRPAQPGALAPQAQTLWIVAKDCKTKARVVAFEWLGQDVALDIGESERAQLPPLGAPRGKTRAWLARSTFAQPAIDAGAGMGVADGAAIALASDAAPQVWNADGASATRVSLAAIDATTLAPVKAGATFSGVIPAMSAQPLDMEKADGPLAVDLPAGVVAFIGPRAVFGDDKPASRLVHGAGDHVTLVNTTDAPLPARVSRAADASLTLNADTAIKRFFGAAGQLSLPLDAQAGNRLFVIGADATVVAKSGRVSRGADIALEGPGEVILDYKPGLVAAWIERKGVAPWPQPEARAAALPQRVALEGAAMRFRIARDAPAMLAAKSGAPALVAFTQNGVRRTFSYPAGVDFHRYVAAGEATLDVYSPHDGALSGTLALSASPVIEAHEGVNDAIAVSPGESALFSFVTKRDAEIGIGVRAEPDRVEARLFDASGKTLGDGVGQALKLAPGRYFLEARAPADATATTIRAAIVGISPPPAAPPAEVLDELLDKAGLKKSK